MKVILPPYLHSMDIFGGCFSLMKRGIFSFLFYVIMLMRQCVLYVCDICYVPFTSDNELGVSIRIALVYCDMNLYSLYE